MSPTGQSQTQNELTLFAEDSPVKTSATPEIELGLPVRSPVCGESSIGSLAYYDRSTHSWKTSERSLFEDCNESLETLLNAGLMRNGRLYPRVPLARHINVSGFSYLPTPLASDWKGGSRVRENCKSQFRHWVTLVTGLPYPNPSAVEAFLGFPTGWTDLNCSETASCHTSENGAADESCKPSAGSSGNQ